MATVINPQIMNENHQTPSAETSESAANTTQTPTNGRGGARGRGRGRGRGKGRGRGRSRRRSHGRSTGRRQAGRTTRATTRSGTSKPTDPSKGWRLHSPTSHKVVLEQSFTSGAISQRARLFCSNAISQINVERRARSLPDTRSGMVVLFMNDVLHQCMLWTNERIALQQGNNQPLELRDLYRYVSILLLSHSTGLSFEKSISLLAELGCNVLHFDRVRFISNNILAFSGTSRGDIHQDNWVAQRDQTQYLAPFERTSFRMSSKIFLTPLHTFATLDDDLYGTRSRKNQVKTLSARKADREGHTADAIADALLRITLMVRFRRRGESQSTNISRLMNNLLECRGESSLHGLLLTADRGYGRLDLLRNLPSHGIGSIFIMPEHILRCHPFVGRSFFSVSREDENEFSSAYEDSGSDEDPSDRETESTPKHVGNEQSEERNAVTSSEEVESNETDEEESQPSKSKLYCDRRKAFIIDESPTAGPASYFAVRMVKPSFSFSDVRRGQASRSKVTAVAIRESGTKHYSNLVRFMYTVPTAIGESIET